MQTKDPLLRRRIAMAVAGMALTGISIGFFKRSMFGVDPYQCFAGGIANVVPLDFGTVYMLVNLVQLGVVFLLDRRYIGISTFINLFLLGYMVEFSESLLARWFGELAMPGRILFLAVGIVVTCIAAALYYTADLGVSTYDAVSLVWSQKQTKLPFAACRVCSDFVCVLLGLTLCLLGGYSLKQVGSVLGVGTIITAFFMGPLIGFFNRRAAEPFLRGRGA